MMMMMMISNLSLCTNLRIPMQPWPQKIASIALCAQPKINAKLKTHFCGLVTQSVRKFSMNPVLVPIFCLQ